MSHFKQYCGIEFHSKLLICVLRYCILQDNNIAIGYQSLNEIGNDHAMFYPPASRVFFRFASTQNVSKRHQEEHSLCFKNEPKKKVAISILLGADL